MAVRVTTGTATTAHQSTRLAHPATGPVCPRPGTLAPMPDDISAGRARIDELDAQIVRLVAERAAVSRVVQAARAAGGGGVLVPGREEVVLAGYAAGLGEPGRALGLAVLQVCRGPLP